MKMENPNRPDQVAESTSRHDLRSLRWEFNGKLLLTSVAAVATAVAFIAVAYWYQSGNIEKTLATRAAAAGAANDREMQLKWLQQLKILKPDDPVTALDLAEVANQAVELPPANRLDRIQRARNLMSEAVAILKKHDSQDQNGEIEALERKLIERELQFGAIHATSIRRRVIGLNAGKDDKEILRAFAIAKHSILSTSTVATREIDAEIIDKAGDYWLWLDQQPLSTIVTTAWQANPNDIALAGRLAKEILERPESFLPNGAASTDSIKAALKTELKEMSHDGQAQLILYSLLFNDDADEATRLLDEQVESALARLKKESANAKQDAITDTDAKSLLELSKPTLPPPHSSQTYQPVWDYNVINEWANVELQKNSPEFARIISILDQLLALPDTQIPASIIEGTYVLRTQAPPDATDASVNKILLAGIERLEVESPKLQMMRAANLSSSGPLGDAKEAVQQLDKTIQARRANLVGTAGTRLTQEQKSAEEAQLNDFSWNKDVIIAMIASREGRLDDASRILEDALRKQVSVSTAQRLRAMLLLGDVYRRMEAWDLAATAFEAASVLSPEKQQLRVLAAQAWTSAGNVSNAIKQWKSIDGNSPLLQVQQLRAVIAEELAKPPRKRNFESIYRRLDLVRENLLKLTDSDDDSNGLNGLKSELALLTLAVPDRDDGSERQSTLQRLTKLADASPDDPKIQTAAALSLVKAGEITTGRRLIERLRDLVGEDSLSFTLTNAKFEAAAGDLKSAINDLLAHAASHPDDVLDSTMLAAEFMATQNERKRALKLLLDVPIKQHTPESGFRLFTYALADLPAPIDSDTDFSGLESAIQVINGVDNATKTWWKLATAIRLLTESSNKDLPAEKNNELMAEASQLSAEISAARPRWCLGLSLKGQISAARGETSLAIQALQAGISNGDVRLSTSYLLTKLLLQMNRVSEAESEYSRFERLRQANANIAAFGVSIAERKGEYQNSLKLARKSAESNDEDELSWLLVAQAAMMAARSTDEQLAKDDLLSEARTALDIATELSADTSVSAYKMRLRFRAEFFDPDALRLDIAKLAESKINEPTRSLLAGLAYVQIKDGASAFPLLNRAKSNAPKDPQVYLALAQYYQLIGDNNNTITSLERAFQLAPTRVDIRNRLALALALRSGAEVPWKRLDNLLDTKLAGDSQNKLLHSLILLNRGDEKEEVQAEQILTRLIKSNDPKADDARRLLASLLRRRWGIAASADTNSPEAQRALSAARGLYLTLINREKPRPSDIYRLGDLLLRAKQTQDVTGLADQLDAITQGSPIALDLRLRLAQQSGDNQKIEEYTQAWAKRALKVDGLLQASVWETAGQLLSKLGYHNESIEWLERAYQDDPAKFRPYILGLTRARRFNEAIELCIEKYTADHKAETAAALADVAVLMGLGVQARPLAETEEALLKQALQEHPKNANLLEAVATMRLAQERYADAIPLYKESARYSPDNVRLLNNLAMAFSEIKGRELEAIPYARRAIKLYGRSPELLDTLGLVLVRNNQGIEAENVLREAISASPDPRYRFHLLVALLEQDKRVEAISQWSQLDLNELRKAALTPAERRDLKKIRMRFEG